MKSQFNHENMNGNQNKRNKHNNNKQFSKPTVSMKYKISVYLLTGILIA